MGYTSPYYRELGIDGYREWMYGAVQDGKWNMMGEALKRGQLTGSIRFVEEVAEKIGRKVKLIGREVVNEKV